MKRITIPLLITNVLLVLIVLGHGAFAQQQPVAAVLRGRALELVDERGRIRCRINVEQTGEVVLRLTDQRGVIRVKLGAGADGSGMLLLDEKTEPGIHLIARQTATADKKNTTGITLTGPNGRRKVVAP